MRVLLEKTVQGANRIWTAEVEPNQLLNLSKKPVHQQGKLSVLMVENPAYDKSSETLQFDLESAILLNLGNTFETIIVGDRNSRLNTASKRTTKSPEIDFTPGDNDYLKELNKLPSPQKEIGKQILNEVRNYFAGNLRYYPKSGKFVESPDNFWVVKVQPRAKSLRIVIYGEPNEHKEYKTIQLKQDMTSYSSFVVSSKSQTQDAVSVIKEAKRLKNIKK